MCKELLQLSNKILTAVCLERPVWRGQVSGGRGEAGSLSAEKNWGLLAEEESDVFKTT